MLHALQAAAAFVDRKIGWSRVGLLLSMTLIGIAIVVLMHILQGIDYDEVIEAIRDKEPEDIAIAALAVFAAYFTLTFYDLFALRTTGHSNLPYRVAALAGFTSYSFGHNVGATVFTGGAVRYRIYSAYGLDAKDVAKVCFVAGLTFWLGNATVLGLGVLYVPQAASSIDQLPPFVNRIIALLALGALGSYETWVWRTPRSLGRGGWRVTLPSGPSTLLQILIGIADLAFCTIAMYMLLPDEPFIGFITLAVIFVTATMLGFASHSPGGLGVFDAAMLLALWQFDREDLVAGLLLFRLLYYIVPFVLCLILLGIREIIINIRPPPVPKPAVSVPVTSTPITSTLGPLKSELNAVAAETAGAAAASDK
jgi:uncharacterized membrane protein YbhN (UPF0104 family)